ncbi:hypothetical protein [Solibacillus sp. FSL K6-1523]|uniref:hypothetical protein n=1 Tax=Solibacillus sp. FSL K6-1523 TaxID=2921471 RepID=UPI0030FBD836
MFNIPGEGWIALSIWFTVIIIPWVYSAFLIKKINDSGVERWGAKKAENVTQVNSEVKV